MNKRDSVFMDSGRGKENIDVFITESEFLKLNKYSDFLPVYFYPSSDLSQPKELGKISIIGGPLIRFHRLLEENSDR
jgi:hypothetical protein